MCSNFKRFLISFFFQIQTDFEDLMKKFNLNPISTHTMPSVIKTTTETAAQTDDRLLIENVKNLNEKLKKRHLESSTTDLTGDSDNYDESRPRRRRFKKRRIKSGTSGDERRSNQDHIPDLKDTLPKIHDINTNQDPSIIVNGRIEHDNIGDNDDDDDDGYNLDDYIIQNKPHDRLDECSILEPNIELNIDEDQILEPQCILREDSDEQSPEFSDIEKDRKPTNKADVEEIQHDKEINRLINLATLDSKRKNAENQKPQQPSARKVRKVHSMRDIVNDADKAGDDGAGVGDSSSSEESTMSEDKFLRQKNLEVKERLLNSSESDVSSNFDESDLEIKSSESESEENGESTDESNAMDTFLNKMNQKEMENVLKIDKNEEDTSVANGVKLAQPEIRLKVKSASELKSGISKVVQSIKSDSKFSEDMSQGDAIVNAAFDQFEKSFEKSGSFIEEDVGIEDAITNFLKEDKEIGEILNQVNLI